MVRLSSEQLLIGLLFVVIAVLALQAPAQSDTWWLLRAGQDIATNRAVPTTDTYSHTAFGAYWPNHEWLTQLLFFALFALGGMPLLTAGCAAAIVAAQAFSWRLCRGSFEARLLLLGGSIASSTVIWVLRPQVITMALFAALCTLLASRRDRWLPVLFLLWANLHGGVALGIIALLGAIVADVITTGRVPRRLALTTVACVAATFLTPLGLDQWSFLIGSVQRSRGNQLIEWQQPDFGPRMWAFWAIAAALPLLALILHRRLDRRGVRLVAIALVVLPLAIQSIRNVPFFLLVAVPACTAFLSHEPPRRRSKGDNPIVNGTIVSAAAIAGVCLTLYAWVIRPPRLGWDPIPAGALTAIRGCPERLFNIYGHGGQLIWFVPEKKVFIDSRHDQYASEFLTASRGLEASGEYAATFERHGIRCAVVPEYSPIAARLSRDPAWSVIFRDREYSVFVR